MKKQNNQSLGELIKEFIRLNNLEDKITETRINSIWENIMGNGISCYTNKISLNKDTLTIYLSSSVLRNELSMGKTKIINMINKELKRETVREIIFR